MEQSSSNLSGITLNFLPVQFSTHELSGFFIDYQDKEHLRKLQDDYQGQFLFKRRGNKISAIPLADTQELPNGEAHTFSAQEDWSLFQRILEEGIRSFLQANYPSLIVPKYGPVWMKVKGETHDLIRAALAKHRHALSKLGFLHIYRKYRIVGSHLRMNSQDDPTFGALIKISTSWQINSSITELIANGIDPVGCYIVPLNTQQQGGIGYKTVGCIREVNGDSVRLVDFRESEFVNTNQYTIEASLENVNKCVNAIMGSQSSKITRAIREEVSKLLDAEGQLQRIEKFVEVLREKPISCAHNLTVTIGREILKTDHEQIPCAVLLLEPPKYVLKSRNRPIAGPISSALASQGPYDQDSFKKTTPHIAVITPKQHLGRVDQFMRVWRDGGLKPPYQKGFVNQYKLRGCDFRFIDFQETSHNPGEDYRQACLNALKESRDIVRRYDMAYVITQEQHQLLGNDDPYLTTKAALMSSGVPVQELKIETIDSSSDSQRFILNNLALVCYAKMGGTPWLLASPKGPGITHELVVGLGSATLREGRLQGQERYIGITTLFNYDGVYLMSNVSKESTYQEYPEVLQSTLISSLEYVSIQKGWQPGERIRLIFHTFKPLKNIEIESVKKLVQDKLSQYSVDFAFLVIGQEHQWSVYRPGFPGIYNRRGQAKGKQVPERGTAVILDEQHSLLSVTGPAELKMADQGCPVPIQLKLNGASTFQDIRYLTQQVFEFTYMSWKTFNLEPLPVTITYSNSIAKLLGRLRHIKNWNSDALQTTELRSSLWFA